MTDHGLGWFMVVCIGISAVNGQYLSNYRAENRTGLYGRPIGRIGGRQRPTSGSYRSGGNYDDKFESQEYNSRVDLYKEDGTPVRGDQDLSVETTNSPYEETRDSYSGAAGYGVSSGGESGGYESRGGESETYGSRGGESGSYGYASGGYPGSRGFEANGVYDTARSGGRSSSASGGDLNIKDCLKKYKFGLFPHPSDPAKFYICTETRPLEMNCPQGLLFDPTSFGCDRPKPTTPPPPPVFKTMKADKIVPDIVDQYPEKLAEIAFPSGGQVDLGKELTPSQTLLPPSIYWESERSFYTLCMVDPDAPKANESKFNEWNHWTVGNIPGNQIRYGQPLVEYLPPCPQRNSPPHRYIYLVYKQPRRIKFNEPRILANSSQNRDGFSIRNFAQKYQLGQPIAGNYFKSRWDRSVPNIFQRIQYQPPQFSMISSPRGNSMNSNNSYSYSYSFKI